jgi:hypothetical protein
MTELPVSVRRVYSRLSRRLAIGAFLDVWPQWAAGSLLLAGVVALACRLFVPRADPWLGWLWLAPLLSLIPAVVLCLRRAYSETDVVAIADWLSGGHGLLLTLHEQRDPRWADTPTIERAAQLVLPRLNPWRRLALIVPALAFLVVALALPQRTATGGATPLSAEIANDLTTTLAELQQRDLVTPEEEQQLEEAIERIRDAADKRVDAGSWEAADALREQVVGSLAKKQDAAKWAQESLQKYQDAIKSAGGDASQAAAQAQELMQALEKLSQSGLLSNAPEDLKQLLKAGQLPADAATREQLMSALQQYLGETNGRFGKLAELGKEFGRFDPAEFPLESGDGPGADGDGRPGRGAVTRGRADAELTWGDETKRHDRFKTTPLPPGAPRSPDDWAPLVEMRGAPQESAVISSNAAARQYDATAGQSAWRRTLAPRHQSAVKRYFAKQ